MIRKILLTILAIVVVLSSAYATSLTTSITYPNNAVTISATFTNSTGHAVNASDVKITILDSSMSAVVKDAQMTCGYESPIGVCVYNYTWTPTQEGEYVVVVVANVTGTIQHISKGISVRPIALESQAVNVESNLNASLSNITDDLIPRLQNINSTSDVIISNLTELDEIQNQTLNESISVNVTGLNQTATSILAKIDEIEEAINDLMDEVSRIPAGVMKIPKTAYEKTTSLIDKIIAMIRGLFG